ncbi:MAG: hypothetical protein KJ593_07495 [Candidatus Omnitrophica bacterium]|nr:hypothetical protein [Candidatus Omnitrophota bacterium]
MSVTPDVTPYLKDHTLLVKLCREVIKHLDSSVQKSEIREREKQLQEITKTIKRLEKANVAVPDALRSEKSRLIAALSGPNNADKLFGHLADEFEDIVNELRQRIGGSDSLNNRGKKKRTHSRAPKTEGAVLRELIIKALKRLGGSAPGRKVREEIEKMLDGKLLPRDLEWRKATNDYIWQNNTNWERYRMTQDGTLKNNSPRGIWELSEEHL